MTINTAPTPIQLPGGPTGQQGQQQAAVAPSPFTQAHGTSTGSQGSQGLGDPGRQGSGHSMTSMISDSGGGGRSGPTVVLKGQYQLMKTLRKTIYGKAKLAWDLRNDRPVCVKLCKLALVRLGQTADGIKVQEDPMKEVALFRRMQAIGGHPHILQMLEYWEDQKYSYTVLEFMSKGEFLDLIVACGRFKEVVSSKYFNQLLSAVAALHQIGVCHLDLSPENMLLNDAYDIKICDFGLARELAQDGSPFPGEQANKPGKVGYMAPEIYFGLEFDGRAADVYCMGVILFIMVTGRPPYTLPAYKDPHFRLVYSGQIQTVLEHMNIELAPVLVDLLSCLVCPANKRLGIHQIANHE